MKTHSDLSLILAAVIIMALTVYAVCKPVDPCQDVSKLHQRFDLCGGR